MDAPSSLPTENVPIKMDPDLGAAVGEMLAAIDDEDEREAADEAVMVIYRSGFAGTFPELVRHYREGIETAIGYELELESDEELQEAAAEA